VGQLTVQFLGICTHFTQNISPIPHRVVLVNASAGITVGGVPIPPHFATILITPPGAPPGTGLGPFSLTGVAISLQNPASDPLGLLPSNVPNLTNLTAPIQPLAIRSSQYVIEQVPQFAAAYFDIVTGTFTTIPGPGGAVGVAVSMNTVPTTTQPPDDDPVLLFTPFPNAAPLASGLSSSMPVASGSTITFANEAASADENSPGSFPTSHFFLHYLTASQMPSAPQVPPMSATVSGSVGGGCSNSQYP